MSMHFLEQTHDIRNAKVVIIPVRFDRTTSWKAGTAEGPDSILDASRHIEHYDNETGLVLTELIKIATHPGLTQEDCAYVLKELRRIADMLVRSGTFAFGLGGEHSITPVLVAALHTLEQPFTVVWFDGHSDFYDEYLKDKSSHACAARRVAEMGIPLVQIGVRSTTRELEEERKKFEVTVFPAHDAVFEKPDRVMASQIVNAIKTEKVYVTIDVDVLHISEIGGCTGTPEPDGLAWKQVNGILRELAARKRVIGADLVEFRPCGEATFAYAYSMAKLMFKFLCHIAANRKK
jgi:agmatinase